MRGVVDDSPDDSIEGHGSDGRLPPDALVGVVETALARALALAAEAGRWEIVAQLAEELAARVGGAETRDKAKLEPAAWRPSDAHDRLSAWPPRNTMSSSSPTQTVGTWPSFLRCLAATAKARRWKTLWPTLGTQS